jgi:S1-C subfamily serine protease
MSGIRRLSHSWAVVGAASVIASLACGTVGKGTPTAAGPATQSVPAPAAATADLARATVEIIAMVEKNGEMQPIWSGSGSVVAPEGLIITNAHVVDDREGDYTHLGVAVTERTDQPPELRYLAEVAAVDYDLDLAVIRIVSDLQGNPVEPALPVVALGDSDGVEIGDQLRILGYPGIGGETITFTEGAVSGFTSERGIPGRAWIKTDATIAGGNSGGMGVDAAGELIGVPTRASAGNAGSPIVDCRPVVDTNRDGVIDNRDTCVPIGGFINGLRPVNLARPLIEAALAGQPYIAQVVSEPPPPGGYDLGQVAFRNLVFSDGVTSDNQPKALWYALPEGLKDLCAFWDYVGMADGMKWSAFWFADGQLDQAGSIIEDTWDGGASGNWWVCVHNDAGLPSGLYELALEVEGQSAAADSIYVGGDHTVVDFTLVNASQQDVCVVQLSPSQAQNWGPDRLGPEEKIDPGGSRAITIATGVYDLLLLGCEGTTLREERGIDVTQDKSYTLAP